MQQERITSWSISSQLYSETKRYFVCSGVLSPFTGCSQSLSMHVSRSKLFNGIRWNLVLGVCNERYGVNSVLVHTYQYFKYYLELLCYRDSSVGIATGYGLDDRGSRVRFPAGAGNFSLHHRVQNGSGAHPASYPMSTRGSFPGGKVAEAWRWPRISI
jgi:hypothetical protein